MRNITNNVLIIGDLHLPFTLDSYLQHCIEAKEKFNCNEIVFIGDIIDNHYSSYHETDPKALSADEELEKAKQMLIPYREAFPVATVIIGNHDRIIMRKAKTAGVSKAWIKEYNEVLGCPNWNFVPFYQKDNVHYRHGEGASAMSVARDSMMSVVQGHKHTKSAINFINNRVYSMEIGCGIDKSSYAFQYAKDYVNPKLNCGIVLENGTIPIIYSLNNENIRRNNKSDNNALFKRCGK